MKLRTLALHALLGWCGLHGAVQAMIPAGELPPSTRPQLGPPVAVPEMRAATITAIRSDARQFGTQLEIGGKWLLVLNGRTAVLRRGLPAGVDALRIGQTVKFSMASLTPGETALGVVDAP